MSDVNGPLNHGRQWDLGENVHHSGLTTAAAQNEADQRPLGEQSYRGLSLTIEHVHQVITQPLAVHLQFTQQDDSRRYFMSQTLAHERIHNWETDSNS